MELTNAMYIINNITSDVFLDEERERAITEFLKAQIQSDIADKILNYIFKTSREGCKI